MCFERREVHMATRGGIRYTSRHLREKHQEAKKEQGRPVLLKKERRDIKLVWQKVVYREQQPTDSGGFEAEVTIPATHCSNKPTT